MSHIHTLKELEIELSFIKDKDLYVSCQSLPNGKQLIFRKKEDRANLFKEPEARLYIHNDLRMPDEGSC
jgi:hypothetical protein